MTGPSPLPVTSGFVGATWVSSDCPARGRSPSSSQASTPPSSLLVALRGGHQGQTMRPGSSSPSPSHPSRETQGPTTTVRSPFRVTVSTLRTVLNVFVPVPSFSHSATVGRVPPVCHVQSTAKNLFPATHRRHRSGLERRGYWPPDFHGRAETDDPQESNGSLACLRGAIAPHSFYSVGCDFLTRLS